MKFRLFSAATCLLLMSSAWSFAQQQHQHSNPLAGQQALAQKAKTLSFIENKGQWGHGIRYQADIPGGTFYLTNQGFVYNFVNEKDLQNYSEALEHQQKIKPDGIHMHSYKVNFVGANPAAAMRNEGFEKRSNYNNYFIGNDSSKWAGHVNLFGKVKVGNIYNGIDVYVYNNENSGNNSLKYDFVIAAGANPNLIQLSYEGVEPKLTPEGNLLIQTSVNKVEEQAPYCYQEIDGRKIMVPSKYVLDKGVLSFAFPSGYNKAYPLTIDPATLIFGTFSGATGGNGYYAHSTAYDTAGNTYVAGLTVPLSGGWGWPTTTGAYQTTSAGNYIMCINKYSSNGSALLFSTYFGSSGGQMEPNTIRVNAAGNLVFGGNTTASNLPMISGAYQSTMSGSDDIYMGILSPNGATLLASTYIGGSGNEASMIGDNTAYPTIGPNDNPRNPIEVCFDTLGNIWMTSNTSSIDFPVTTNALQSSSGGGIDAVVCKFNGNLSSLLYSTYLGGSGWDGGIAIEMDHNDSVVVAGMTSSIDFPTTSGALNTDNQGGQDGFVARIDPVNGGLSEATYLGTIGNDDAERIAFDPDGNVFIAGRNLSGFYTVSPGAWNSAGGYIYIQKLSADLSTALKSTTLADHNSTSIVATGFMVDECGNMVIGTVTNIGQSGLELTSDAFQTTSASFYLATISRNFNTLLFGSYYGSTVDHYHPGVTRIDPNGNYYQSVCRLNGGSGTPNAYSPTQQNSSQDVFTFKFRFPPTGVKAQINLPPGSRDTVCAPYTFHLGNSSTSPYSMTYTWDPGDGSPVIHTTDFTHTYDSAGVYTVTLNAHSDSACITDDYSTFELTVVHVDYPQITASADTLLCNLETSLKLWVNIANPDTNNTIEWLPANGIISGGNQDTVMVDPTINTYYVVVKDTIPGLCGFASRDTVHVDFFPRGLDILTNDTAVCKGSQVQVDASSAQGYTFVWTPNAGVNDTTALNPIITANQTETYTLTAHHPGCLDTSQTLTINVQDFPVVTVGNDIKLCQWQQVSLNSDVTPYRNDYIYQWSPTTGLDNPNSPNAHFTADTSGWYYLNVQTPIGCSGKDSVYVTVFPGNFGAVIPDTNYCPPNQVNLWATGGVHYTWSPSDGLSNDTIANPIANPAASTRYKVYIQDVHGCKDTGNVMVTIYPSAVLNIPDSITVYPGETYHLEPATNCVYFDWFPTNGVNSTTVSDPVFNPIVRTRYFVTGETENGCIIKDSIDVLVKSTVINMPNAFTPGDGINGTFKIEKRGIAQLKDFSVYNRWGNKVFSTTDLNQGWDGDFNGKAQPMGVYIYSVEAVTNSGKTIVQRGNVTLVR